MPRLYALDDALAAASDINGDQPLSIGSFDQDRAYLLIEDIGGPGVGAVSLADGLSKEQVRPPTYFHFIVFFSEFYFRKKICVRTL